VPVAKPRQQVKEFGSVCVCRQYSIAQTWESPLRDPISLDLCTLEKSGVPRAAGKSTEKLDKIGYCLLMCAHTPHLLALRLSCTGGSTKAHSIGLYKRNPGFVGGGLVCSDARRGPRSLIITTGGCVLCRPFRNRVRIHLTPTWYRVRWFAQASDNRKSGTWRRS